jgi:hypothetical protein
MNWKQAAFTLLSMMLAGGCHDSAVRDDHNSGINIRHLVTLGTEEGVGALSSPPSSIATDSRGRWYVTAPYDAGEERAFVFDSSGEYLQRIGGIGEGPGEFQRADVVTVSAGDSLIIRDSRTGRVSVFSSDYEFVRTIRGVAPYSRAIELGDGTFVVNNTGYPKPPLTRFDRDGATLGTFGETTEEFEPLFEYLRVVRVLTPGTGGRFWSAKYGFEYSITQWDSSGTAISRLSPEREWFPPYDMAWGPAPDREPNAMIWGLWEDHGLLWVVAQVSDPQWNRGLGGSRRVEGHEVYQVLDPTQVWDALIEVIDPASDGRIVHQRRFEDALYAVVGPGVLYSFQETELGFWLIDVWQVELASTAATEDSP